MSNEDVTQLHHRVGLTLTVELSKMVQKEATESGSTVEAVIAKAIEFYCDIEDMGRNYDFVKVRKAR